MVLKTCEYCEKQFEAENDDVEFCSDDCERQEEIYRNAEAADYAKFEEMAYGPPDVDRHVPTSPLLGPWEQEAEY